MRWRLLPRYRGNKIAVHRSFRALPLRWATRCASRRLPRAKRIDGVRYFFVDDPEFFDREQTLRRQERRLSGQCGAVRGIFARGDRIHEARLAAGRGSLPRLAIGAGAGAAAHAICATIPAVRSLPVVFTIHNLAYQGLFPQTALRKIGLAGDLLHDGCAGILRQGQLSEGRADFCRLS